MKRLPNTGQILDRELKIWEMESATADLQHELLSPEKGEYLPSSSHQIAATPYGEPRVNTEKQDYKPSDGWGTYQENIYNEPGLLYLSIHGKVLKYLTGNFASWISSSAFPSLQL